MKFPSRFVGLLVPKDEDIDFKAFGIQKLQGRQVITQQVTQSLFD